VEGVVVAAFVDAEGISKALIKLTSVLVIADAKDSELLVNTAPVVLVCEVLVCEVPVCEVLICEMLICDMVDCDVLI
jgi:hypothetical protein